MLLLPLLTILWLLAVAAWFRKSRMVLLGGLLAVAGLAFGLVARRDIAAADMGLTAPRRGLLRS